MNKRGFEFTFTWIFVLAVGAIILLLAVFMASRLINREGDIYNTQVAAELGAILSPLETGVETGKYYPLSFPDETRLTNDCDASGTFGHQEISVSVRSGVGREWRANGLPYQVSNKFVFSEPTLETKQAHLIATPLVLPFKVGDALVLYAETYCLVNMPESFTDEVDGLGAANIVEVATRTTCPAHSVSVCFGGNGCDITVQPSSVPSKGTLIKEGKTLRFSDGLFYAALVSDPDFYACQLTRIRKRASELSALYTEKSMFLDTRGCSSSLAASLQMYRQDLLDSSTPMEQIITDAEALRRANDRLACRLF